MNPPESEILHANNEAAVNANDLNVSQPSNHEGILADVVISTPNIMSGTDWDPDPNYDRRKRRKTESPAPAPVPLNNEHDGAMPTFHEQLLAAAKAEPVSSPFEITSPPSKTQLPTSVDDAAVRTSSSNANPYEDAQRPGNPHERPERRCTK